MRRAIFAIFAVLAAGLMSVGGCHPGKDVSKPIVKKEHDHPETGPHKGALAEWGNEEYHIEFTVDHGKKQATVYVLDDKAEKQVAIPVETLTLILTHDKAPIEIVLKADPDTGDAKGKSSRFVAVHDELGKEIEFRGTVRGKIGDGDPFEGDFVEKSEHKHEKK